MTQQLVACGHCRAAFLPRRAPSRGQRYCSRSCARRALQPRRSPAARPAPIFLRLLQIAPFERRQGGWRFGTKQISDSVVARLIAAGKARIDGDLVRLVEREAAP